MNRQNDIQIYLKYKYPSLEDLEEENEDTDSLKINEVKDTAKLKNEAKVLLAQADASTRSLGRSNNIIYERVVKKNSYVKEISYGSNCRRTCVSFKGYVNKKICKKFNFMSRFKTHFYCLPS